MPTYEYECLKCGKTFEVFQNINDAHLKKCTQCNGKVRRLIGAGCGLIFKGSGFFITDYKKKNSSITSPNSESKPKEAQKQETSCATCPQNCAQAEKKG